MISGSEKSKVSERLRKEINGVIKCDEDITVENFKKIPYLECVILEIIRVFCVVPHTFHRVVKKEIEIRIHKGTRINFSWISIFYNPEIFDKPSEFIPERW